MSKKYLSVILVDDEVLVRSHIQKSIDWKSLELEVIAEASDGHEALSSIRSLKPAIAIVDINMPFMNGITLSEQLQKEHPDCKIIILSGFNTFDYAKQALNAGVFEYVLKPLREEELRNSLIRARDSFRSSFKQKQYIKSLEVQKESIATIRYSRVFSAYLSDHFYMEKDLVQESKHLGLSFTKDSRIIIAAIDINEEKWSEHPDHDRWNKALHQFIISQKKDVAIPVVIGPDDYPVFLCQGLEESLDVIKHVKEALFSRFGFSFSCGISEPATDLASIRRGYLEAKKALSLRFFQGQDHIAVAPIEKRPHQVIVARKSDIMLPLRLGNLDDIVSYIDSAVNLILEKSLDYESVELMYLEMLATAAQFLNELDLDLDVLLDDPHHSWREVAKGMVTLNQLRDWLIHVFELVLDKARDDTRFKTYQVVDNAIEFICGNYQIQDLNLRAISSAVHVNPTYLSKVFKLQTNSSIIEYVREKRLQSAMVLLQKETYSHISEIAYSVGFSDPLYFSKVFKKRFGVPPKKIRPDRSTANIFP